MTGEKFAEIVTKRANVRLQKKIEDFKREIMASFTRLTGSHYVKPEAKDDPESPAGANAVILEAMLEGRYLAFDKGWPKLLWKNEEQKVQEELLAVMDEMQKALLAPGPKEDDCTPAEEGPSTESK